MWTAATLTAVFGGGTLLVGSTGDQGWLDYIQSGGVVGMFIVLSWALYARKIVMGWTYDAMVVERDYYRGIALKTTEIADRQVGAAERMLGQVDRLAALEAKAKREGWDATTDV